MEAAADPIGRKDLPCLKGIKTADPLLGIKLYARRKDLPCLKGIKTFNSHRK